MSESTCLRCGERYTTTREYRGNYCRACHEAWVAAEDDADGTPTRRGAPGPRGGRPRRTREERTDRPDLPVPVERDDAERADGRDGA